MVASAFFMNVNNAILKLLTEGLPVGEIMFLRAAMILPLIFVYAAFRGGRAALRINQWQGHVARGVCLGFSAYFFLLSVQYLPLGMTVALTFAAPLLITAMAGPILGEEVGWRRWAAVAVGFLGVVVITRPGTNVFQLAALLPLVCALASAGRDVATRRMTASETSLAILLTANLFQIGFGLLSLPWGWVMPDARSFWLVAACVPLVNIAQPYKSSGMMLTCLKENNVMSPEDFPGKTLGVWFYGNEYPFLSWMAHLGIPTDGGEDGVTDGMLHVSSTIDTM